MIHIISLDTYIHKIVRGNVDDDNHFHPQYATYDLCSAAIEIGRYLGIYDVQHTSYGICGKKALDLIDQVKSFYPIPSTIENEVRITLSDEEEYHYKMFGVIPSIPPQDILNFKVTLHSQIKKQDTLVFSVMQPGFDPIHISQLYNEQSVSIDKRHLILHPSYYSILKEDPCDTLIVNMDLFKSYYKIKKNIEILEIIAYIKYRLRGCANQIIVSLSSNHLLYFIRDEVYECKHHIRDSLHNHYETAIASALFIDQYDVLRNALSFSVASSLSVGMYTSNKTVIEMIKKEVIMKRIL